MPAGFVFAPTPNGPSLPVGNGALPPTTFPPHSLLARSHHPETNGLGPYGDMNAAANPRDADGPSHHPAANGIAHPPNGQAQTPARPHRVLLLLDAQVCRLSDPPLGVPSARAVGANIAKVLAAARACAPATRPRIVHVRKCGMPGDPDEPRTATWALVHEPLPDEHVVDKRKNNAFTGTNLAELVPPDAELIVVGLESDFCVRATCSAALARGNDVLLIRGAHATYDRVEYWDGGTSTPADRVEREIEEELEEAGVVLLDMADLPSLFAGR